MPHFGGENFQTNDLRELGCELNQSSTSFPDRWYLC